MSFEHRIVNLTDWDYPIDFHEDICHELSINPRVFVVPAALKPLVARKYEGDEYAMDDVRAFADESGTVVFFYEKTWTPVFRRWVLAHELQHIAQFAVNGNMGARRWDHLRTPDEMSDAWEREAEVYADRKVGKRRGVDFQDCCLPEGAGPGRKPHIGRTRILKTKVKGRK